MVASTLNVALSEAFWLGLGGIIATLLGGALVGWLTFLTQRSVAAANAQSQLAIKQTESQSQLARKEEEEKAATRTRKRTEKTNAIIAFLDASDAYWHMINDLWDRVKRDPNGLRSFREETAEAAKGLTRAEMKLDLVSDEDLRNAASAYVHSLVESAKSVHQDKQWKPPNRDLRARVVAMGREELGYHNVV